MSQIDHVLETVRALRNIRQQYTIPFDKPFTVNVESGSPLEQKALTMGESIIQHFIKLESLTVTDKLTEAIPQSATNVVGHSKISVPLAGLIDVSQELSKLQKKQETLKKEQDSLFKMMSNMEFLERAPQPVIEKNKGRLNEVNAQIKALEEQLASFA